MNKVYYGRQQFLALFVVVSIVSPGQSIIYLMGIDFNEKSVRDTDVLEDILIP